LYIVRLCIAFAAWLEVSGDIRGIPLKLGQLRRLPLK
jgi:hypothetical protein